jgi:hypothetical protein
MNLVRHELGQSKKEERFPKKENCLAIYSLTVNSRAPLERVLTKRFPWCEEWLSAPVRKPRQKVRRTGLRERFVLTHYFKRPTLHGSLEQA